MKNKYISIVALSLLLLSSCGSEPNKVEAKEAQKVEIKEQQEQSTVYEKVKEQSVVKWQGSIIGGLHGHNGTVKIKEAKVIVTEDNIDNAKVTLDMTSIDDLDIPKTEQDYEDLVGHLKSADFFNVSEYPEAIFELTQSKKTENGKYNITGNLTLLGVTKNISFDAEVHISPEEINIKSEPFTIDRTQWGIEFHKEGTVGLPANRIISNNITLEIDATIAKN